MNGKIKISLALLTICLICNSSILVANSSVNAINRTDKIAEISGIKEITKFNDDNEVRTVSGTTTSSNTEQIIKLSTDSYMFYAGGGPQQEASITTMYNVKFSIVANETVTIKVESLANFINNGEVNVTLVFRDENGNVVTKNVKSTDKQVEIKFSKAGVYTLGVINNMSIPVHYNFTLD